MTENDLTFLKKWFSDYTASFYSSNEEDQKNIALKVQHTYNVYSNITHIAKALSLPADKIMLAEVIALFHDLGRFPQYEKYRTFKDSKSLNHGLLGAETLIKENVLQNLSEREQDLIIKGVKFHNTFTIPDIQDKNLIFFLKLIRDADKLDIWRIFVEYYDEPEESRASATGHGLPDIPYYSKDVLSRLYRKQIASYSDLKTLTDFKLLQLSWVYDLNFKDSFKILLERGYIDKIFQKLPQTEEIISAAAVVHEHVQQKLR